MNTQSTRRDEIINVIHHYAENEKLKHPFNQVENSLHVNRS